MASRKQVENKAAKLGGKLIIHHDGAELQSPIGKHWDGYHNQVDYFYNDGKQAIWDAFWIAVNNQEDCDCGKGNDKAPTAWQKQLAEMARIATAQIERNKQ